MIYVLGFTTFLKVLEPLVSILIITRFEILGLYMLILSDVAVPILIWIVVKGGRSAP